MFTLSNSGLPAQQKSLRRCAGVFLAVCACLTYAACFSRAPEVRHMGDMRGALPLKPTQMRWPLEAPPAAHALGRRAYLRAGDLGPEGLGSLLQHFKHSIVLADALDAEHILSFHQSHHGYSSSQFWNGRLSAGVGKWAPPLTLDASLAGRVQDFLPFDRRERLVRGLCAGEDWARAEMANIRAAMEHFTSIVDVTDAKETTEDLNGCVAEWVRRRVAPAPEFALPPLSESPARRVTVGVHIRWGDQAWFLNETGEFYGSMAISDIAGILRDIRARWGESNVEVKIAMQDADHAVLSPLGEQGTAYTLIDSGDPIADLYALSNNDILIVGQSSYAVIAHLIAPPGGLTIAELARERGLHKFTNATGFGRHLVPYNEYTPASLDCLGGSVMAPEASLAIFGGRNVLAGAEPDVSAGAEAEADADADAAVGPALSAGAEAEADVDVDAADIVTIITRL
ncbi:hypothetical protein GGX14DRAFT_699744 [Mycena pura]|uniref:Uncharacterized protein n=1 Tax=Mycena pura TaxID=153505 RepID=A0AAD6V0J2_9AGAR|nr:hypothetical protein GGX14DRAFT_699744 [Mycena pura]